MKRIICLLVSIAILFTMAPLFAAAAEPCATDVVFEYDMETDTWSVSGNTEAAYVFVTIFDETNTQKWYKRIVAEDGTFTTGDLSPEILLVDIDSAYANFYAIVSYNANYSNVTTDTIKVGSTIDDVKTVAKQDVNDAFAGYDENDYSAENWAEIEAIKDAAIAAIDASDDEAAIPAIAKGAIKDMAFVLTIEQIAGTKVNAEFDKYNADDYSTENYAQIVKIRNDAIAACADATEAEAEAIVAKAAEDMAAVLTIKEEGVAAIEAEYAKYDPAKYSDDEWNEIVSIKDAAIEAVNAAANDDVDAIVKGAIKDMAFVLTAKQIAETVIKAEFDKYDEDDYCAECYAALVDIMNEAIAACADADKDALREIVVKAIEDMEAVLTIKEEAIDALISLIENMDETHYSEENWEEIIAIAEAAALAILVADNAEVEAILSGAEKDISFVLDLVSEAKKKIEVAFDSYDVDVYGEEIIAILEEIMNEAFEMLDEIVEDDGDYSEAMIIADEAIEYMAGVVYNPELEEYKEQIIAEIDNILSFFKRHIDCFGLTEAELDEIESIIDDAKVAIEDAIIEDHIFVVIFQLAEDIVDVIGVKGGYIYTCCSTEEGYISEKIYFSAEQFDKAIDAIVAARNEINSLNPADFESEEAYIEALDEIIDGMNEVLSSVIYAYEEAANEISDYVDSLNPDDYSAENWSWIQQIAEEAIDYLWDSDWEWSTAENCFNLRDETIEEIEAVKTLEEIAEEEAAARLQAAKDDAKEAMAALLGNYSEDDYSDVNWDLILGYYDEAIAAINNATDVDSIYNIVTEASSKMADVLDKETEAKIEAAKLSAAKVDAIQEVNEKADEIIALLTTHEAKDKVDAIRIQAVKDITDATSIADVEAIRDKALDDMELVEDNVPTGDSTAVTIVSLTAVVVVAGAAYAVMVLRKKRTRV